MSDVKACLSRSSGSSARSGVPPRTTWLVSGVASRSKTRPTGTGGAPGAAPAGDDLPHGPFGAHQAGHVGVQERARLCDDAVEHLLLRRSFGDERRDAPERRLLLGEPAVGGLALAEGPLAAAALELGGGAGGEDAQRGQLVLPRPQRRGRQHAEMAEVLAVGAVQGHGEVALQPQPADQRVVREARHDALGERHDALGAHLGARGAGERVLHRRREPVALPAGEEARPRAVLGQELGDEGHVRREGLRDPLHQPLEERLADRAGGSLGDEPEQVLAAGPGGGRGVARAHGGHPPAAKRSISRDQPGSRAAVTWPRPSSTTSRLPGISSAVSAKSSGA